MSLSAEPAASRPAESDADLGPRRADPLARLALAALGVSLLSGLPLIGLYRSEAARGSIEALSFGMPLGWWLRGVHWVAATGLVALTLGHGILALYRKDDRRTTSARWWTALLSGGAVVLAGLSGFVLRGDAEALGALAIWRGLTEAVPVLGPTLGTLALGAEPASLSAVALHHVGTFSLLSVGLAVHHGALRWPDLRSWVLVLGASVSVAAILPAALFESTGPVLEGPWFLLGLQAALLLLPPWVLGLASLLLFSLLVALPRLSPLPRRRALIGLSILTLGYGIASLWLTLGAPGAG